jgi:hypothetical protein
MIDGLAAFIVGEGNWLPLAMGIAVVAVAAQWRRHSRFIPRERVMEAMNLFSAEATGDAMDLEIIPHRPTGPTILPRTDGWP